MTMTFNEARLTLETARREADGKPIQNNTRLFKRSDDTFAIKLHAVDVVTINSDHTWTLRAEGWHTVTTLERIRGYAPVNRTLFSEKGDWYVRLTPDSNDPEPAYVPPAIPVPFTEPNPGPEPDSYSWDWWQRSRRYRQCMELLEIHGTLEEWGKARKAQFAARRAYLKAHREWDQRNRVPFYDGITVDSNGYAQRKGGPSKAKLNKHEREVERIKKAIDKYVNNYIAALKKGMPMPGNGDCWYCLMRTNVDRDGNKAPLGQGVTWGDLGDNDHLFQHIKDKYYVPMLAVNALRERGYQDVGVAMWLDMRPEAGTMGGGTHYDGVKRDLVKYMRKRMIPAAPTK